MTKKHTIRFTAYGTPEIRNQLFAAATTHEIWSKTGAFIQVPEKKWMPIPLKPGVQPVGAKVY